MNVTNASYNIIDNSRKISLYFTAIFIIVGLIGNSVTIFVFGQKRFRQNSSNVYIFCLAINDFLYLIVHFFKDFFKTLVEINEAKNGKISSFLFAMNIVDRFNMSCLLINYLRYVLRLNSAYISKFQSLIIILNINY
jgi:hypothetical protein